MRVYASARLATGVANRWRQRLWLSEESTRTERAASAFAVRTVTPASWEFRRALLAVTVMTVALACLVAPTAAQSIVHIQPVFEVGTVNVLEGGSRIVGVKLSADPGRAVTVRVTLRTAGTSITLASQTLVISRATWNTFSPGQWITLNGPSMRRGFQYRPTNYFYFSIDGSEKTTRLVAEPRDTEEFRRPAGIVPSKPKLRVNNFPPGSGSASATYGVRLASRPHHDVDVRAFGSSGVPFSIWPLKLEFTPENWHHWQESTVTFTAQDSDMVNDRYKVCHRAESSSAAPSGGDMQYHGLGQEAFIQAAFSTTGDFEGGVGCFTVVEMDQDIAGIVMIPSQWDFGWRFDLPEGDSRDFDVRLRTQPSHNVTLTPVRRPPSDLHPGDATITSHSLTFTATNWGMPQTLTFTAAEDDDDWRYTRAQRFDLTTYSSDPDYDGKRFFSLDVRAVDNDEAPGVDVADQDREWIWDPDREVRGYVSLPVGQTSTIYMRLTKRPLSRPVTISPKIGYYYNAENGSDRITILDTSLTFTTGNWNTYQPVRIRANTGSLGVAGEIWIFFSSTDDRYDAHRYNTMRFSVVAASAGGNSGPSGTEAPEPEVPQPVVGQVGEPEPEPGGQGGGTEPDPEAGGQGGVGEPDLVEPVDPPEPQVVEQVEERDPDAVGVEVRVAGDFLKITDGESATYGIVLEGPPTHHVTIVIEKDFGPPLLSVSPTSLVFTPDNWDQPQQVVVLSPQDGDSMGGNGLFFHTVTSDDEYYDGLSASDVRVRSTEFDNFQGGGASFRAWLARLPAQHNGGDFAVRLGFDAVPESLTTREIQNYVIAMQGGVIAGVQQVNTKAFNLTVRPDGNADVVMTIRPTGSCGAVTDVCTRRNGSLLPLQIGYEAWIPGPLN